MTNGENYWMQISIGYTNKVGIRLLRHLSTYAVAAFSGEKKKMQTDIVESKKIKPK